MPAPLNRLRPILGRLWRADAPLTATGLLMLVLLALTLVGLWLDPRTITNAPAWLKPAKFAASIAIYALTLAWIFTYLRAWRRTRRIVGWTTAAVLVLEFVIIATQAWRGTASHFNVGTPLNAALFAIMGVSIAVQTLVSIAVAVALWRERFEDAALGWALRLGMIVSIVGASSGGLMTAPTTAQLEAARGGERLTVVGAHTVGAPDGGPGLPGTGWRREHGDVRVAHFVGLHALQALPLLAWLLRRRRVAGETRTRLVQIGAASYALLFALLLWQAVRGQSILQPDATTAAAFLTWIAATAISVWLAVARTHATPRHAVTV
jgi:hypothetical protein